MPGDYSRLTFDPRRHYSRVLQQQGRVQLDADWNEYADILTYQNTTQLVDLIGPLGTPAGENGFLIQLSADHPAAYDDCTINPGRIYVQGTLCELDPPTAVNCQVDDKDPTKVTVDDWVVDGLAFAEGQLVEFPDAQDTPGYPAQRRVISAQPSGSKGELTLDQPAPVHSPPGRSVQRLCRLTTFQFQPFFPSPPQLLVQSPPHVPDNYLAYLDVWQRTVTALGDPTIADVALGGADTAVRSQTIWQVKLSPVTSVDAANLTPSILEWKGNLQAATWPRGQMAARRATPSAVAVPNQLYRVEIHSGTVVASSPGVSVKSLNPPYDIIVPPWANDGVAWQVGQIVELIGVPNLPGQVGASNLAFQARITAVNASTGDVTLDVPFPGDTTPPANTWTLRPVSMPTTVQVALAAASQDVTVPEWTIDGADWDIGQTVEIAPASTSPRGGEGTMVAQIIATDSDRKVVTLDTGVPAGAWTMRRVVTFKWARDNASVAGLVRDAAQTSLTIQDVGGGSISGFAGCPWIELTTDERILQGAPGVMLQVKDVDLESRTINLFNLPGKGKIDLRGWTVRRWDSWYQTLDGLAPGQPPLPPGDGYVGLEAGVEVRFTGGHVPRPIYLTGDHWLIPARTNSGTIEWPSDARGPLSQPPAGADHAYCPLAVMNYDYVHGVWTAFDCRPTFGAISDFLDKRGDKMTGPLQISQPDGTPAKYDLTTGGPTYLGAGHTTPPAPDPDLALIVNGGAEIRNDTDGQYSGIYVSIRPPQDGDTARLQLVNTGPTPAMAPTLEFNHQDPGPATVKITLEEPQTPTLLIAPGINSPPNHLAVHIQGRLIVDGTATVDNQTFPSPPPAARLAVSASAEDMLESPTALPGHQAHEFLSRVEPVRFAHTADPGTPRFAFRGEEQPESLPQGVPAPPLDTPTLLAALTRVVQEQVATIASLSATVSELAARVRQLEDTLLP